MIYRDRKEAGEYLAQALKKYKNEHPVVLAIPCGGAELGFEVATALDADFDLIIVRKLPFPDNPAVASVYANWYDVSDEEVLDIMEGWKKYRAQKR